MKEKSISFSKWTIDDVVENLGPADGAGALVEQEGLDAIVVVIVAIFAADVDISDGVASHRDVVTGDAHAVSRKVLNNIAFA